MDRPVNFAYLEPRVVETAIHLAQRGCEPRVVAMSLWRSGVPRKSAQLLAEALVRVRPQAAAPARRPRQADREALAAAAALAWVVQTLAIGAIAAAILWLAGTGLGYEAGYLAGASEGFDSTVVAIERALLTPR